jgi:hypothetical protein
MATCANMTASPAVSTSNIISGNVKKGSVGCATYYTLQALNDPSMCPKAMTGMGDACSGAALLQASWSIIALLLLAMGMSA